MPKNDWGTSHKFIDDDSGIRTEFITYAHEPGKIYTRRTQPTEDVILKRNQKMRNELPEKDLTFGRHVACIPMIAYMKFKKQYPELSSKDQDLKNRTWAKILKDPANKKYLVRDKY